jgi:hypothetical protein
VSKRRMRELIRRYLDTVAARSWSARIADWVAGLRDDIALSGVWRAAAIALLFVACLATSGFIAVRAARGNRAPTAAPAAPQNALMAQIPAREKAHYALDAASPYGGPSVHALEEESTLVFSYAPPKPMLFRTKAVEAFDPGRGAVSSDPVAIARAPEYRCAAECTRVRVEVDAGPGLLPLPVPTGYAVEATGVRLSGLAVGPILLTSSGDPVLELEELRTQGTLEYVVGPSREEIGVERLRALAALPTPLAFPEGLESAAASAIREKTVSARVAAVVAYVSRTFMYDRSPSVAEAYRTFAESNPRAGWLDLVASLKRGDCDVENSVAMALLRRAGVPSRLAIGYAGEAGAARPGMHAWIEYYDNGYRAADATTLSTQAVSLAAAPARTVVSESSAMVPTRNAPRASPRENEAPRRSYGVIAAFAASVAALALLIGAVLLAGSGKSRKLTVPKAEEDRRRVAADMLLSAFTSPDVWLKGGGLDGRPLLPTLGNGAPLSLEEARRLSAKGALWFSNGCTGLAKRAAAKGARVLDASDSAFGEIAPRIPGAQDLDAVAKLAPTDADALSANLRSAGRMIEAASALLSRSGVPSDFLRCCPGLVDAWMRDVDLSGLTLAPTADLPTRFIAVSPSHPMVEGIAARAQRQPALGAFLLVDAVVEESGMLAPRADRIRRKTAKATLEEVA